MDLPCFTDRETEAQNEDVTGPGTDRSGLELYSVPNCPVSNIFEVLDLHIPICKMGITRTTSEASW